MLSGRTASGLRNILSLLQGPPPFTFSFIKLTGYKEANSHTKTEAKPLKLPIGIFRASKLQSRTKGNLDQGAIQYT